MTQTLTDEYGHDIIRWRQIQDKLQILQEAPSFDKLIMYLQIPYDENGELPKEDNVIYVEQNVLKPAVKPNPCGILYIYYTTPENPKQEMYSVDIYNNLIKYRSVRDGEDIFEAIIHAIENENGWTVIFAELVFDLEVSYTYDKKLANTINDSIQTKIIDTQLYADVIKSTYELMNGGNGYYVDVRNDNYMY